MAITATFAADFSSFNAAIERADVKLRGLDSSSKFVERSLNRMTDTFSGRKLIQEATLMVDAIDRIGGTSKLTETELQSVGNKAAEAAEKMKKLGIDVPPKLDALAASAQKPATAFQSLIGTLGKLNPLMAAFGASLSIASVVGFAKEITNFSGKMLDLEAQTHLTTDTLQAFDFIGGDVGLTIEDITTSADQLSKRLGGDDKSVNEALQKLNISGKELKTLNLDQVMYEIDRALVGVGNQFERSTILNNLFGRSGAQLGRLMTGSLEDIIKKTKETGPIIDHEILAKADRFGELWEHGWKRFQAAAVTAIDTVSGLLDGLVTKTVDFLRKMPRGFGLLGEGPGFLPKGLGGFNERGAFTPEAGEFRIGGPLKALAAGGSTLGGADQTAKQIKSLADAMKSADEEAAKYRDHLNEVGLRMRDADAAAMAFFRQMGTGIMAMRGGNNPQLLLPSTNPFTALGMDPRSRPGSVSQNPFGSVLTSLRPGPSFLGGLTGGFGKLIGGMTGGGGFGGFASNLGGSLVGGIGNLLGGALTGGISSLLGAAVGGLGKLFGGLFGAEGKKTNRARDAAIADVTGISGDKGASQAKFRELATAAGIASSELDKLFSTKKQKEFEAGLDSITKKMDAFASEQEADSARLTAAIEKYGISFEQAGAAFQKQELDKQAKELIEDWRVLVGSGIDVGVVNEKMAESINDYLQTAVRVGQEVPNALRPIISKMLEQGLLTDEAGNAITDLEASGIHFSETMTEGFDKVVKKLDELITKLGLAGEAIAGLPVTTVDSQDYPIDPRFQTAIPMASGGRGRVTKPTLFLAGEAGPEDFAFGRSGSGSAHVADRIDALSEQLLRMTEGLQRMTRDNIALAMGQRA